MKQLLHLIFILVLLTSCTQHSEKNQTADTIKVILPTITTERVKHDSDDSAICINPLDSTEVMIIGTDKGGDTGDGGLYAFNLSGKIIDSVRPLKRPNNVDIAYGL